MQNFTSENAEYIGKRPYDVRELTDSMLITINDRIGDGFSHQEFTAKHQVAKDSGGFNFLQNPELASNFKVEDLVANHRRIGIKDNDIIIAADFPIPRFTGLTKNDVAERHKVSCDWFEQMHAEIPQTIPVIHGRTADEAIHHLNQYDIDNDIMVGFGSNLAQSTRRVMDRIGNANIKSETTIVSKAKLWDVNLNTCEQLRKEEKDFFLLGAGGMNAAKIATMLGAKCVDATSWRLNAMLRQLMDCESGRFIKVGKKNNLHKPWAANHMKKVWNTDSYPFSKAAGFTFKEMMDLLRSDGAGGTSARGLHNVWEQDQDALELSTYNDDPDGLYRHIMKQWNKTSYHHSMNKKVLEKAWNSRTGASQAGLFTNFHKVASS